MLAQARSLIIYGAKFVPSKTWLVLQTGSRIHNVAGFLLQIRNLDPLHGSEGRARSTCRLCDWRSEKQLQDALS